MRAAGHSLAALGAVAAVPFAAAALALRPRWRIGWRERMGALPRMDPGGVWIHGASVGEILAAGRLVDVLVDRGCRAFTSTFTVTGREAMRRAR